MPDDLLGVGKALEKGIDVTAKAVATLFGPAGAELGQILADPLRDFRERRKQRANQLCVDAVAQVEAAGRQPRPVPGRILLPILEHGSLEEDDELKKKWESLLANAADPTILISTVSAVFPDTLKQLSPLEARVLDAINSLWVYADEVHDMVFDTGGSVINGNFFSHTGQLLAAASEHLAGLRLIQIVYGESFPSDEHDGSFRLNLTEFGALFRDMCRRVNPEPHSDQTTPR